MTLGEPAQARPRATSQKSFAAELGIHENSVSNAERRNSATHEYLLRIGRVRNINLHWLLTGQGAMRVDEDDAGLLAEKDQPRAGGCATLGLRHTLRQRASGNACTCAARRDELLARDRRDRRHVA